jgi:hypothetical protein
MRTVSDIMQLWPRSADLARELGVSPPRLSDWKNRNSIPAAYWRDLIRAARRHGHPEITAELLVDLHAREQPMEQNGFGEEDRPFQQSEPERRTVEIGGRPVETGHFSRFKHLRRSNFASIEEINEHIRALREEWDHR